ncbi:MAG: GNAT family N-acetyltransferase [Verrucomicrobia bacterium]|nr:GNAT family N-acetyltransferase [Verrucomicrobiota bacterium]
MIKYLLTSFMLLWGFGLSAEENEVEKDAVTAVTYVWEDEPDYVTSKKIFVEAFGTYYSQIPLEVLRQPSREAMREWLENAFEEFYTGSDKNSLWLAAKIENKMIGFLVVDVEKFPEQIYLQQLAVDPSYQRRGVASSLIRGLFKEFRDCSHFVVVTRHANEKAKKLYLSLGFSPASYMHEGYSPELYTGFEYFN